MNTGVRSLLWGGAATAPCLLDSLLRTALAQPDAIAVHDGTLDVSYAQLLGWARSTADLLIANGIGEQDTVAVTGPRGTPVLAALLGTISLGATYVPLDAAYPARRLAHMLDDSAAKVALYVGERPELNTTARLLRIPELPSSVPFHPAMDWRPVRCRPDLPAYVIYTSGSTGWPKGVAIPHSCLDNMVEWQVHHSPRPHHRTSQFAPLNFDVYFQEVLGTLCGGGTVVIVPERLRQDPFSLLAWLADERIERLFLPNVALHMLAVAASAERSLEGLRLVEVNTAGEQLVCTPAIRDIFRRLPGCRLTNHYGQSECAMVTAHVLAGPSSSWPALPPIGVPLPGCELLVEPTDPAEPAAGELLVAGLPLSLGYLGLPELNAERFVRVEPTPHGQTVAFRTGDLVRFDGEVMHFTGRLDDEVKIRGVRVNPLEVEACLLDQPGVLGAVCVVVETGAASRALRAAITLEDERVRPDLEAMRAALAAVLPAVMVPLSITVLDGLPHTPSGKTDRAQARRLILQPGGTA